MTFRTGHYERTSFYDDVLEDLDAAKTATPYRHSNIHHFRNALHAFLRDAERAQRAVKPLTFMASDSVELRAYLSPTELASGKFYFDGLVERGDNEAQEGSFDRLVGHQLFEGMGQPVLFTGPHFSELENASQTFDDFVQNAFRESISPGYFDLDDTLKYLLLSTIANDEDQVSQGWKAFRGRFLPSVQTSLLNEIRQYARAAVGLHEYRRRGKFCLVQSPAAGDRSLFTHIFGGGRPPQQEIWRNYRQFCGRKNVLERYADVSALGTHALNYIRGDVADDFSKVTENDAESFAIIDLLNNFFDSERLNCRVELITRTTSMLAAIAMFPDNVLNVTVRHPMLVPDIYKFSTHSLNALSEHLQRIDTLMASGMALTEQSDEAAKSSAGLAFATAVREIHETLEREVTTKQAQDHKSALLRTRHKDEWESTIDFLGDFARKIEADRDRGAYGPIAEIARQNIGIVQAAFRSLKARQSSQRTTFRVLDITSGNAIQKERTEATITPYCLRSIRMENAGLTRLFHIHSERCASFFNPRAKLGKGEVSWLVQLDVDELSREMNAALESLSNRGEEGGDQAAERIYNIDVTLIACIVLASNGSYQLSANLASSVLHIITTAIRKGAEAIEKFAPREILAYRELLLCRHYCERALARSDFHSRRRRHADSKGSIALNLGRAQRDLDFAAYTSEEVERREWDDNPTPAGAGVINDGRLRLAHATGWLDQLVMALEAQRRSSFGQRDLTPVFSVAVRNRREIWTAAGLYKEAISDAHRAAKIVSKIKEQGGDDRIIRYYAHLETRSIQAALSIFIVFLSYPISEPLHRLWLGDQEIEAERLLVFRDWKVHHRRILNLQSNFAFRLRLWPFMSCVLAHLSRVEDIRREDPDLAGDGVRAELDACSRSINTILNEEPDAAELDLVQGMDGGFLRTVGEASLRTLSGLRLSLE